jgi:hypothetical protein
VGKGYLRHLGIYKMMILKSAINKLNVYWIIMTHEKDSVPQNQLRAFICILFSSLSRTERVMELCIQF